MKIQACFLGIASLLLAATGHAANPYSYYISSITATDLGTLGGAESKAMDINNAGEIVGWAENASGVQRAFLFSGGSMQDIGYLFRGKASRASGINNVTEVVGHAVLGTDPKAFHWHNGTVTLLQDKWSGFPKSSTASFSYATAINDYGHIVGTAYGAGTPSFAMYWVTPTSTPVKIVDNPSANLNSRAFDINNAFQITGYDLSYSVVNREGFVYQWSQQYKDIPPPGLAAGVLHYDENRPYGINDHGHVTGAYRRLESDNQHYNQAIIWHGNSASSYTLGQLSPGTDTAGKEINNQQFVCGEAEAKTLNGGITDAAFIWHAEFGMQKLPPLAGWGSVFNPSQCKAHALNDMTRDGLIQVAGYCTVGGNRHAVRWDVIVKRNTPVSTTPR